MFEYSGERSADKRAYGRAFATVFLFFACTSTISALGGAALAWSGAKDGLSTLNVGIAVAIIIIAIPVLLIVADLTTRQALVGFEAILERLRQLLIDTGHDLATPVAVVQARMQILERDVHLENDARNDLQAIKTAMMDLTALINDLRLLANTETVSPSSEMEFVSFNELVKEAVAELETQAKVRGQHFKVSEKRVTTVVGDRSGLKRVVTNLLMNAVRYGEENRAIGVDISGDNFYVTVNILSPGKLIPEQDLPHLFERYFTNDEHREREGFKSGLGLAIVRAIIDAHGGKVQVQTVGNDGNNFIFTVPKVPARHPALSLIE